MTALIGLAIVAIWLVVLVPMFLNRHDADDASRSVDSFSTAMRVLSRRSAAPGDRRYVLMPRRDSWGVTVDNNPGAKADGRALRRPLPIPGTDGRARLLARRRRVALVLAALAVVLFFTALLGWTSWWYELAVDLAGAGYLVHLRNEALRARELRRRRLARAARAARVAGTPQAPWQHEPADERIYPADRSFDAGAAPAEELVLPPMPVSAVGTENGSRWEPVPVPLPTYVSKPVVSRPAASAPKADVDATRTIDLTRPGAWSEEQDVEIDHRHLLLDETGSGRISASPGAPASGARYASGSASSSASDIDDDELDVILERRRAVGD